MEQLLGDIEPPKDKVFDDLAKELRDGLVCPVLMGSATRTNGVLRLMKALRHEAPDVATTAKRLGVKAGSDPLAYVLKTLHTAHGGKMSVARVLNGQVARRHDLPDARARGRPRRRRVQADGPDHREARPGAASARPSRSPSSTMPMTGDTITAGKQAHRGACRRSRRCRRCWRSRSPPRSARTTSSSARRCTSCWRRIPRSPWCTIPRRTRWWSGGRARCICGSRPSGWPTGSASPSRPASRRVGYRETIKKAIQQRGRHKKQSGGHGQYGDVVRRHQAAAARLGLRVRGGDQGRRGAAQLHPVGGGGRARRAQARPARLPGGRRRGEAGRRLLSHRRFLRHGVPARRPARP